MPTGSLFLVVGLGNPGSEYSRTRHNAGFEVVDLLAKQAGDNGWQKKFQGLIQEVSFQESRVLLLKPQTYMNLSGESVRSVVAFYKLDPATQTLVISDDVDLPLGRVRIRLSGGSGGHNGLKSIRDHLGTDAFPRLRLGVGRDPRVPTDEYVLAKVPKPECEAYDRGIEIAKQAVLAVLKDGFPKAMEAFNKKDPIP